MGRAYHVKLASVIGAAVIVCSPLSDARRVAGARGMTADRPRTIQAVFVKRSYAPGERAELMFEAPRRAVVVQVFRVGLERLRPRRDDVLLGVAAAPPVSIRGQGRGRVRRLSVAIGQWPSGLYFARLGAAGGWLGFAPVVVRARPAARTRVAVIVPTNTWQAYNFRDVDRDGVGDTWYADSEIPSVDLRRTYLNRGVPPHFRGYDRGFHRWLARSGRSADYFADDDLERFSGARLAALYDLIVFPGHEEYVTEHVYDSIVRFRDLGGNLAFLSANNFFYRVERRGDRLFRTGRWRDLGRPEAPLIGSRFVGWFENRHPNRPYLVVGSAAAPWLFQGTGLRNGHRFGLYGIEVDARAPDSPPGTRVLARIPNVFGRGRSAEMTYYETATGAKVFAAGVLNFGGSAEWPAVSRLLSNLWNRLSLP